MITLEEIVAWASAPALALATWAANDRIVLGKRVAKLEEDRAVIKTQLTNLADVQARVEKVQDDRHLENRAAFSELKEMIRDEYRPRT